MVGGYLRLTKVSRTEIIPLLPGPNEQVGVKHGEQLAAWCAGGSTTKPFETKKYETSTFKSEPVKPDSSTAALKRKLWEMTGAYHMGSKEKLNQWLWDECRLFLVNIRRS